MKYLFSVILLLIILSTATSQINGNGNIKTISQDITGLESIDIQFNADIIIDYNQKESMIIQADENVLEFIGISFTEGHLALDQIKWIHPSKQPLITIGAPHLKAVFQGTHSKTSIKNVTGDKLSLNGNVGKIVVSGNIVQLSIHTENTTLDLGNLKIGNIRIAEDCTSDIVLDQFGELEVNKTSEPNITFLDPSKNEFTKPATDKPAPPSKVATFINFKIKNNSFKRNAFYVKGPNGRGGNFSYGFSMFPYTSKKENWSIGTKIYKESRSGKLQELVTITKETEGTTIDLFN